MTHLKLAIIGGGPIGLALANLLQKNGHKVDLFEKDNWPKDKTCGQGLMPSGRKILESLGVSFDDGIDSKTFSGIHYKDFPHELKGTLTASGTGIERRVLSEKIHSLSQKKEGIKLYPNSRLINIIQKNSRVFIAIKNNKDQLSYQSYDYVFACDGLHSSTRKILKNVKTRKNKKRMGAREHFNTPPWSENVEVYWQDGIEAYVTPVNNQQVEVAFLWFEDLNKNVENLHENLWENFPDLREKCKDQDSCQDFRGYGPFVTQSRKMKIGNIFFLGDAYYFLDGITGEGVSLGLKASAIIAENFNQWQSKHSIRIKLYYLHYTALVKLSLFMSRHKNIRRFVFRVLNFIPKSFDYILIFNDI
jgi:2-polyprenyl-6-methoxyphenol hydroxylase-like FAD-dependent oxidoreductase